MKTQLHNNILMSIMTRKLFLLFTILNVSIASAQTFTENGVKYDILPTTTNVQVVSNSTRYTGAIAIPESVVYNSVTYTVTTIGQFAFYSNIGLTSVTMPNTITTIRSDAFFSCNSLTSIIIPNSVTSIERQAFSDCTSLTSLTIPDSVTSIKEYTFYNCSSLISVAIGNSVTSIGEYTFRKCSGLTSIIIPNLVTYIDTLAFADCTSLTTVTIPASVTRIGVQAFADCTSLTTVNCAIVTPIYISVGVLNNVNQAMCALNVPAGSVNAYKAANVWKDFNPINGTLSTESFTNKNNIKIYPNPVSNMLTVENPSSGNLQLKVMNKVGQLVLNQNQNASSTSLDVSNLSKGLYFLNMDSEDGNSQTIKFIKN